MKDEGQHPDFNCAFENLFSLCMHKKFQDGLEDIDKYSDEIAVGNSPGLDTWLGALTDLLLHNVTVT